LLLRDIEGHIRRYAFANRLEPRDINTELVRDSASPGGRCAMPRLRIFGHISSERTR
jgi:hypothetical protein